MFTCLWYVCNQNEEGWGKTNKKKTGVFIKLTNLMHACIGNSQQRGFKCGSSLSYSSYWILTALHHNPLVLILDCRVASRCSESNWDCREGSKLPHFLRKRKEIIFNWAFPVSCGVRFSSGKYHNSSTLLPLHLGHFWSLKPHHCLFSTFAVSWKFH